MFGIGSRKKHTHDSLATYTLVLLTSLIVALANFTSGHDINVNRELEGVNDFSPLRWHYQVDFQENNEPQSVFADFWEHTKSEDLENNGLNFQVGIHFNPGHAKPKILTNDMNPNGYFNRTE